MSANNPRNTVIPFNHVTQPRFVWQAAANHLSLISNQAQNALLQVLPYRQEFYSAYKSEWLCIDDLLTVLSYAWSSVADSDAEMPNATSF